MKLGLMDWHIGWAILLSILVVTLAVVFLTFIFSLIDEAQLGGEGARVGQAVVAALWALPPRLLEIMPFTVFMGALIGLGVLSSHSETTVYRSAGVSTVRIAVSCAIPSLIVVAILMGISMTFTVIEGKVGRDDGVRDIEAEWVKSGSSFVEIGSMSRDGVANDVVSYVFDDERNLTSVARAQQAQYDWDESKWRFEGTQTTRVLPSSSTVEFDDEGFFHLKRSPESLVAAITKKPKKMTLIELAKQIEHLKSENLDARRYQIEFWRTLLLPVSVLGLVLIATSFVMGQTREMGMGTRLMIGVAVGFVFHYVQAFVTPLSIVYDFHPLIAIGVPVAFVWTVGGWLTVHAR